LVVLADDQRTAEIENNVGITIQAVDANGVTNKANLKADLTFSPKTKSDLEARLMRYAADATIELALQPKIVAFTLSMLAPNYIFDDTATVEAENRAANLVAATQGRVIVPRKSVLVPKGETFNDRHYQLLRAE